MPLARILGIDPGNDGGLFLIDGNRKALARSVMPIAKIPAGFMKHKKGAMKGRLKHDKKGAKIPRFKIEVDANAFASLMREYDPTHVFLEYVTAMTKQGVVSMFNFGMSFGMLRGVISALGYEMSLVRPKVWQGITFKGLTGHDTKELSRKVASMLWPDVDFRRSKKARILHSGMCDAACMAEYGRIVMAVAGKRG